MRDLWVAWPLAATAGIGTYFGLQLGTGLSENRLAWIPWISYDVLAVISVVYFVGIYFPSTRKFEVCLIASIPMAVCLGVFVLVTTVSAGLPVSIFLAVLSFFVSSVLLALPASDDTSDDRELPPEEETQFAEELPVDSSPRDGHPIEWDPVLCQIKIFIGKRILEQIGNMAESVFRPGENDVEITYAMLGDRAQHIDRVFGFSSEMVVKKVNDTSVEYSPRGMANFLEREGAQSSSIIVIAHTHPYQDQPFHGAEPSDEDLKSWERTNEYLSSHFSIEPILFAVHSVSRVPEDDIRLIDRTRPQQYSTNSIRWNSLTRDHKLALFTAEGYKWPIELDG